MRRRVKGDSRFEAEKAFKAATTRSIEQLTAQAPSVSLRIDRDVLDSFQAEGPGWHDRINAALRKAAGK